MSNDIGTIKSIVAANVAVVYEDAAQPAVRVLGKTLAQCTSLFATPIGRVAEILGKNIHCYLDKLEGLREDQIVNPNTRILVPILEKMRYTDDVLVADYYAQILATASTKESAKLVSVAFIEILNRLSADELKMLEFINSPANTLMLKKEDDTTYHLRLSGSLPVLNVHVKENSGGYYVAIKNLSYLLNEVKLDFPENYNLYIDNMIALGLMIKPAMIRTNDNNVYKFIKDLQSQQINKVQSELDPENSIDFSEARIEITDLGRQLILVGARKYVAT